MTPGTRSRHAYMGVLEPWIIKQKKVFTSWVNQKLRSGGRTRQIDDLFVDLADGLILYDLLEVIADQSLSSLGKLSQKPRIDIQKVANLNVCFKYLRQTVKTVGIGETGTVCPMTPPQRADVPFLTAA
jgi:hypothetical protein